VFGGRGVEVRPSAVVVAAVAASENGADNAAEAFFIQTAAEAALEGQGNIAGFFGDHDDEGVGFLGNANRGAVAGAHGSVQLLALAEGENAAGGGHTVVADDDPAIVQRAAGEKEAGEQFGLHIAIDGHAGFLNAAQTNVALKGTRGAQVLSGLALAFVGVLSLTHFLQLHALNWIFRTFSVNLVLAFVIIFQQEIRRALAELGSPGILGGSQVKTESKTIVDPLVIAVRTLSQQKIGALIALERDIGLRAIEETGVAIDGRVRPELLTSLFFPRSPLHDGGVIIRDDRIVAAGCVFPLSQREELHRSMGTRHRAAIGITEETDALVIVVSEETGNISLAFKGRLSRGLDEERLRRMLNAVLARRTRRSDDGGWADLTASASEHGTRSV